MESLAKPFVSDEFLADGPSAPDKYDVWLAALKTWRDQRKQELKYKDDLYLRPDLEWTRHIFNQDQLLAWDRSFYDPTKRAYTVEGSLAKIEGRFGKLDSVLIWTGYPNLGLDDRNQFDLVRDMPGGVAALRDMVSAFHKRGVRVFLPVTVWDEGTRNEGRSRADASNQLIRDIGADGINLDTLNGVPDDFRQDAEATSPWTVMEPQFDPQNTSLSSSAISWDDWVLWEQLPTPFVPRVSRVKWLEPRHAVEVTDRYPRDKIDSLQHAFFNGQGYVIIENFWGYWSGFSPRDAEAMRRFTRIERACAGSLVSPDWQPHTPVMQPGVFASQFPTTDRTLWTLVNRNEYNVDGEELMIPAQPGARYFDLWHGRELVPKTRKGYNYLSFSIESLGFGAVLSENSTATDSSLEKLLAATQADAKKTLGDYSQATPFAPQTLVTMAATARRKTPPDGMIAVPTADYDFAVNGIEVENGDDPGVDVQFPWESSPRRYHRHTVHIPGFFIDRTPVTNSAFKKFLGVTHYHPADDHNFLRDWRNGEIPVGWANKPVTWVSLEDARAYAAWAGKRLPHVWEWQYAAQGTDGRIYPWGSTWNPQAVPAEDHSRQARPPSEANAFPLGASPFGVLDMVGNVEQWTDEFDDSHTRAAILRGGDYYRPLGAMWYFPKSYRLDEQEKLLLMAPSRDRSGLIGFRCVQDAGA